MGETNITTDIERFVFCDELHLGLRMGKVLFLVETFRNLHSGRP
jgi:hypothetical protein